MIETAGIQTDLRLVLRSAAGRWRPSLRVQHGVETRSSPFEVALSFANRNNRYQLFSVLISCNNPTQETRFPGKTRSDPRRVFRLIAESPHDSRAS